MVAELRRKGGRVIRRGAKVGAGGRVRLSTRGLRRGRYRVTHTVGGKQVGRGTVRIR